MRYRRLGRTDLEVPAVSFGAWAIGGWYWGGPNDREAERAIHAALDVGMNALDTAPMYGYGHSERVIGEALRGRREEAIVMTKVGLRWDAEDGELFFQTVDENGTKKNIYKNSRPESVRLEVDRSLERLGVERIDLIQVHWPDTTTPIADTMGALLELRAAGKVREIGVSNYTPAMMDEAQRALGDVPLASDQPQYSLVARAIERDVLPWALEKEVGLLVYSPLDQGLLTGKVTADRQFPPDDGRNKRPTFRPENRRKVNEVLAHTVEPIARAHGATIGETVIAWTVSQRGITSALVGTRTVEQVNSNARGGGIGLTPEEHAAIDRAFSELDLVLVPARGARLRKRLSGFVRRLGGAGK